MDFGIIAIGVMAILGAVIFFAPASCTRADKRDDPDAVVQVKKLGTMLIGGAIVSALYLLKYSLI